MDKELTDFLKECISVWDNKLKQDNLNLVNNLKKNWLMEMANKADKLLENEIEKNKFKEISIWDIAEFWIKTYPDDIFIHGPYPVPEIRDLFTELLTMKKS